MRRKGLASHLHEFLEDEEWTPAERPVAQMLRERIAKRVEESFSARIADEDGKFPALSAVLENRELLSQVPADMARRLESVLAERVRGLQKRVRRDVQFICHAGGRRLKRCLRL